MATTYDHIGRSYALTRQPDARIAAMIREALGDARSIVNVGAGAGSCEPAQLALVAVDPSIEMIRQRPIGSAPAVLARAEALPFRSRSFDAALAVLAIHHWTSIVAGLSELRRVATRVSCSLHTTPPATGAFGSHRTCHEQRHRDADTREYNVERQ